MSVNVLGGGLEFEAGIDLQNFSAQFAKMESNIRSLSATAASNADQIESLFKKVSTAVASYASLTTATGFIGDVVKVRGEFQQLNVAFETMLKSKEKADKLMQEVTQLAATTPFTLQDVGSGAKQLLAYGTAAEDITKTLTMLGNVASGVGAPLNDLIYLYGTLQVQGRAYTRDILQFQQRGIDITSELAKQFGVTKDRVSAMVEAGKVGFPEVQKAFEALTGSGGMFFNLMEKQSHTLTGQLSNLQDAWSQMLNEIGKSNEGFLSGGIETLSDLVKNYKTVLDVIKALVITYGAYKAATLATIAVKKIDAAITGEITIAERLRTAAALASEKAMTVLNRAMLTNPAVLLATGVAAVVSALLLFNRTASEAEKKQQLLNDVQAEAAKNVLSEKNSLESLLSIAKDEAQSKEKREQAIRKINAISPEYLGNLSLEKLNTAEATKAINDYINSLDRKARAQAASRKLEELQGKRLELESQQNQVNNIPQSSLGPLSIVNTGKSNISDQINGQLADVDKGIKALKETYKDDLNASLLSEKGKQEEKKRTLKLIDDEIKLAKEQQAANSSNAVEYQAAQEKINKLEDERKKIAGETKAEKKAEQAEENKINQLLEQRKNILEDIAGLQREARQSGMIKEQSELDKINEKYDNIIEKVSRYNEKANKIGAQGIGQVDINRLNQARAIELQNAEFDQDAARYKKSLDDKKALFERYEEDKAKIGAANANRLLGDETKGFGSYLEYLKNEGAKIMPKIVFGIANKGELEKFQSIVKEISDENNRSAKQQQEEFVNVINATATYSAKRAGIDENYQEQARNLEKLQTKFTADEYAERVALLSQAKDQELTALDNSVARQSALYKRLGQDVINYSRDAIQKEIEFLKTKLNDPKLTPQIRLDVQSRVDGLQNLLDNSFKASNSIEGIIKEGPKLASAFNTMASGVEGLNDGLANSLRFIGSMISGLTSVASQYKEFLKQKSDGSTLGQITAGAGLIGTAVGVVSGIVGLFTKASEERKKLQAEVAAFQNQIFLGEVQINELYRQRRLEQVQLNQLRLQGLKDERDELLKQQPQIQSDFNNVLAALQKQTYTVLTKKINPFGSKEDNDKLIQGLLNAGLTIDQINEKFKNMQDTFASISLKNLNYDELEKLFTSGQLDDRAKALFEELQKLKAAGLDVSKMLDENKKKAQETFTGTTADSIVDSIADGFANGLRSVQAFADKTEDIIRGSMLNALKYQFLQGPIQKLYEQLAADAESNGGLDTTEIANFTSNFNGIISNAEKFAEQIEKATGVNLSKVTGNTTSPNTLQGAIKGMTDQQAELLAGQFGGLRLTAADQLKVSQQSIIIQQSMDARLAQAVIELAKANSYWQAVTTPGSGKRINI